MTKPALLGAFAAHSSAAAWTPASLSSQVLRVDASDTASITDSSGRVSQINDASGNGNHWTQGFAPNQPLTNSHTLNGLNVVYFQRSRGDQMLTAALNLTQPFTVFTVYKPLDTNLQRVMDAPSGARSLLNPSSGQYGLYAGSVVDNGGSISVAAVCQMAMFNGTSSKHRINGSLSTGLSPGTNGFGTPRWGSDGSGNHSEYDFAYFVVCNGDQSGDFSNFYSWSQSTWGVL